MLRNRILMLMAGCFLMASGAWADDVGYIDCSKNSDGAQVFGKPRRSPDIVGSLPCGERFTVLVYGFYFSRIQTKDGQIGYIYSSMIALDRGAVAVQPGGSAQQTPTLQPASDKTKIPSTRGADAKRGPTSTIQSQTAAGQPVAAPSTAVAAPIQSAAAQETGDASFAATSKTPEASETATPVATAEAGAEADKPAATTSAVFTAPPAAPSTPNADAPEPGVTTGQPNLPSAAEPQPAAQPVPTPAQPAPAKREAQPTSAEPAAPAIRPADTRESWEKPRPSARTAPLFELYGGYAFARLAGGAGSTTNFNGALGSFGWNFKPWLQIAGDSSYSFVTVSGTKNVLYGNHYGPRYFHRTSNRWHLTPFAEALVGGSRAETIVSGTGGYTASANSLSFKVGGGVDYRPSRRWEIRLIDFDYYRTSFAANGANAHQNNYWASTGIVLRLFGGGAE